MVHNLILLIKISELFILMRLCMCGQILCPKFATKLFFCFFVFATGMINLVGPTQCIIIPRVFNTHAKGECLWGPHDE